MTLSYLNCAQLYTQVRYMVNRDPATKRGVPATKRALPATKTSSCNRTCNKLWLNHGLFRTLLQELSLIEFSLDNREGKTGYTP